MPASYFLCHTTWPRNLPKLSPRGPRAAAWPALSFSKGYGKIGSWNARCRDVSPQVDINAWDSALIGLFRGCVWTGAMTQHDPTLGLAMQCSLDEPQRWYCQISPRSPAKWIMGNAPEHRVQLEGGLQRAWNLWDTCKCPNVESSVGFELQTQQTASVSNGPC